MVPHLDPTKTGHPPCNVRGSVAPLGLKLNQNAAPPCNQRTTSPTERKCDVCFINIQITCTLPWQLVFLFLLPEILWRHQP